MDADFPAAHSMDTEWFAIDALGHVAIFLTGEDGHAPEHSATDDGLLGIIWRLFNPEKDEEQRFQVYEDAGATATSLGLFFYNYGIEFDPIGTYARESKPIAPLHVDQLPPQFRERCRAVCFRELNFFDTPVIQPLECWNCVYWYEEDRVAYVASDQQTVRPIRGMEHRLAEYVEQLRRKNPELAAKYRFEKPGESRKKEE